MHETGQDERDRGRGAVLSPVLLPGDTQDPCGGSGPTTLCP